MRQVGTLWRKHRMLLLTFVAAILLTIYFGARFFTSLAYWPNHNDVEIRGWMTLSYVAHSYNVEESELLVAANLEELPDHRIRISKLAEMSNMRVEDMQVRILFAIAAIRAAEEDD